MIPSKFLAWIGLFYFKRDNILVIYLLINKHMTTICWRIYLYYLLFEGAITNGQSRDTDNIRQKTQNEEK